MSFTFGFYNALNHDRRYNAIEMSRIFDGLLTDCVYPTVGHKMMVRASGTDNSVIVGSGRAWFNHSWNYNDADMPLTGPASHILYPRWDAVVLDINSSIEYRTNSIIWVTGTAASSPVKPTMVHTETHNQYPLAYIYRPANDNTIPANRITNPIGTAECPYAGGLLVDRRNIAQIENNDHATKAYAQGEYLIWYDQLYKVTTAISQGAAIIAYPTTGFNIKATTIATELYEKFVYDTEPISGSNHPVTSDGIYRALGNNKIIQPTTTVNQNDPTGGKAVITSKGLYAALGNRTSIQTSAPASGGTNLMTNGQVYTAIGDRTRLSILHGDMQDHPNSWADYELPTTYTLSIALGNKHKLQPTDTFGQTHPNANCEYVMTSKAFTFGAPASGGTKFITNGQVYTALGNRTNIQTSAPTQNSNNLITAGQVYTALGNHSALKMQVVEKNFDHSGTYHEGDEIDGNATYTSGNTYICVCVVGFSMGNGWAASYMECEIDNNDNHKYSLSYGFKLLDGLVQGRESATIRILEIFE